MRILPNGQQVKREVDFVLDECFETMSPMHFHIREVIFVTYNKVSKNFACKYCICISDNKTKKKCYCIVHQKSQRTNYETYFIYLQVFLSQYYHKKLMFEVSDITTLFWLDNQSQVRGWETTVEKTKSGCPGEIHLFDSFQHVFTIWQENQMAAVIFSVDERGI